MEATGFTVERTRSGKPAFARIDLRKYPDFIHIFENNGFKIEEEPIKWTEKMKRSFAEAKNGEWKKGDINNFWDV